MEKTEQSPLLLAIETATEVASVAVFSGERLLGEIRIHQEKVHARLLLPMIQSLLRDLTIDREALSAIGVSSGPGSYTGLRVGVSAAKGLCLALGKPLIAVPTLESLARQVEQLAASLGAQVCPLLDARRMEVYAALYGSDMQERSPTAPVVVDQTSFWQWLEQGPVIFVGDGAAKCRPLLEPHSNAIVLPDVLSSASGMGKPLLHRLMTGHIEDLVRFEPFYLKQFVATKPK